MNVDTILQKLAKKQDYEDLGRDVSPKEVKAIEDMLDVQLPDEYVQFLIRCGYVFWFGTSILGIAPDDYDSVVHWTKKARTENLPPNFMERPKNGVVVCHYGGGGYYFLYDKTAERAGEVILLLDELYGKPAPESWPNFWRFLESFL